MAESPKRGADKSQAEVSRVAKPSGPTGETARAGDSVPVGVGPFTVLPTQFGRYRIDKLLGKGAMGAVYLAHDTQLDRPVALKVARVSSSGSSKAIQRMETEAKAAAKIDHPLICKVYDFGEIDGIRYIALQYIQGEVLKSYLNRVGRRREPAEAIKLILQLARALKAAHDTGVIHRDLKTENVMLNRKSEPVIMDFGLARRLAGATNAGLTQGMIVGTAAYMSPEQAVGKAEGIDHRSDLYALGVILFEMLTGEWPFTGGAIEVMGRKCVQEPPSPLSVNPEIPPRLAEICHKMIAQKKENRYADAAEIIAALESVDPNAPLTTVDSQDELSVDFPQDDLSEPLPSQRGPSAGKSQKTTRRRKSSASALPPISTWWRDQPRAMQLTLFGCTGVCCVVLAVMLFFRKGDALVKVEIHAEDVEVTFQNETLTLADGAHQFKVAPGDQTLHIKSGHVEFDTDKFTLKRGTNPAVTVELVKSEIVTRLGEREIGRKFLTVSSTNQEAGIKPETRPPKSGWQSWPADAPPPAIAPFDAVQAKKHQEAWSDYLKVPVEYTNSIGMKFRLVPPGEFMMGSTPAERDYALAIAIGQSGNGFWANCIRSEAPRHQAILTQPFYLAINELTQAEYEHVVGKNPSYFSSAGGGKDRVVGLDTTRFPVEQVSWNDTAEFCAKLSQRENLNPFYSRVGERISFLDGTGYRLPTDAEWEFACRAGTTTRFWNSDDDDSLLSVGWSGLNASGRTHPVGKIPANPFGLFDVHGNVQEWVQDGWGQDYYREFIEKPALNPTGPSFADHRVARNNDWGGAASACRSSGRLAVPPTERNRCLGVRVALSVNSVKAANAGSERSLGSTRDVPRVSDATHVEGELPINTPIDLLEMVELPNHAVLGNWKRSEGGIACTAFTKARFMAPVVAVGSYDLTCKFTRHSGRYEFGTLIPVGERNCLFLTDGWDGKVSGLDWVDKRDAGRLIGTAAAVIQTKPMVNEVEHVLRIAVTQDGKKASITAFIDGSQLISWQGNVEQLSIWGGHALPNPHGIGVISHASNVTVHELKLELKQGSRGYRLGDDWKNPIFVVGDEPTADITKKCLTWNGRKYFISDNPMSFSDAQLLATQLRGRLLTISSPEEESFIRKNGQNRLLWMAGWRPPSEILEWRDERNRPLRYIGKWALNQPNREKNEEWNLFFATEASRIADGWHDIGVNTAADYLYACIEWGEEYLDGVSVTDGKKRDAVSPSGPQGSPADASTPTTAPKTDPPSVAAEASVTAQPTEPAKPASQVGENSTIGETLTPDHILTGHQGRVKSVLFAPNGRLLTGSNSLKRVLEGNTFINYPGDDNTVRMWNVSNGSEVSRIDKDMGKWGTQGMALSANGALLAVSNCRPGADWCDATVTVWSMANLQQIASFKLPGRPGVWTPWFSKDGNSVFAIRGDTTIHELSLLSKKEVASHRLETVAEGALRSHCVSADRTMIYCGMDSGLIKVWKLKNHELERELKGHTKSVVSLALSPDGKLVATGSQDSTARVWDTSKGELVTNFNHPEGVTAISFADSSDRLIGGGNKGLVVLWDLVERKEQARFEGHTAAVSSIAISANKGLFATGSNDDTARTWRLPKRNRKSP